MMASRDNKPPTRECPFCGQMFRGLGNHLPMCKERGDRDYSMYLSKKTLENRARGDSSRKTCPKCHKNFLRLDTHIKNSPFCKSTEKPSASLTPEPTTYPVPTESPSESPLLPESRPFQNHAEENSYSTVPLADNEPATKLPLILPTTLDGWSDADAFFTQQLVPSILSASSPDEKNKILVDGIYDYFAQTYGTRKQKSSKQQKKVEKHDRALKKVRQLKNEARRDLRQAKKEGLEPGSILSLSRKFFKLVREHSQLKRSSVSSQEKAQSRKARQHCHRNFWKFTKDLLDDNSSSQITPKFTEDKAFSYFKEVYHASPRNFDQPAWLPSAAPVEFEFNCGEVTTEEIQTAVNKSKSSSTPSPFDQISYQIMKKCPSLSGALLDLFNSCWSQSVVPSQWRVAAIKLIGKSSAADDPTSPGNFWPIALTPCVGKLFTTILRNRWLAYMTSNKYISRDIQKAFMTATPGCTEHHCKLAAVLSEARKNHKSLAVCWLDLANAYGSVHHSLIQFSLQHYHAPPLFQDILGSLYSDLAGRILTQDWATPTIPLETGVYQGDPLSVVVFNTVINTLVDTLQTRVDLGYTITNSNHQVNLLQYANDTCLLANSPAAAQRLLDMTSDWLQWSGMRAKVSKCHSLAVAGRTGKLFNPQLQISGDAIPYVGNGSVKFLGLDVRVPHNPAEARTILLSSLQRMLKAVDTDKTSEAKTLSSWHLPKALLAAYY